MKHGDKGNDDTTENMVIWHNRVFSNRSMISQQGDNNEVFNRDRGNTVAMADLQELSRRKQMDTIILLYNRIIIHGDHYKE